MNLVSHVELQSLSEHERELTVTVSFEAIVKEQNNAYLKLQKSTQIKGFRPGAAPRKVLENYYKQKVNKDVYDKIVSDSFPEAVKKYDLVPVSPAQVTPSDSLDQAKDFTYKAKFEVMPQISVKNWQGLSLNIPDYVIDDAIIETELQLLREKCATFHAPENRDFVCESDLVDCDIVRYQDGKPDPNGSQKNKSVALFESYPEMPDLKEALLGKKLGETVVVKQVVKHDHHHDHDDSHHECADQIFDLHLTLNGLKERVLPKLDDELAKDISDDMTSLEDLRMEIKKQLSQAKAEREKYETLEVIGKALIEANPFNVPSSMIEQKAWEILRTKLSNYPTDLANRIINELGPKMQEALIPQATFYTKLGLIQKQLASDLHINPSEDQIKDHKQSLSGKISDDEAYSDFIMQSLISAILKEAQVEKSPKVWSQSKE